MTAVTCGMDNKVCLYRAREDIEVQVKDKKSNPNQGFLCVVAGLHA